MAGYMADLIAAGKAFGVFDFFLPFIIMFAIFWGLLTKTKIFGDPYEKEKGEFTPGARTARIVNAIISAFGSLFVIAYTPVGITIATFLSNLFAGTLMVILSIIAFALVLYVALGVITGGKELGTKSKIVAGFVVLGAILLGVSVYISSAGAAVFPGLVIPGLEVPEVPTIVVPQIPLTTQDIAMIFLAIATAAIIIWVTKAPPAAEE